MKPRNREVNIFNMSLLDILCGALGAFCFMMLSLLPYYRPPGKNINISQEQKELLDEVQKIKDLAERLKNTSRAEDLTELVKQLKEMIAKLENEIKQLQGQVNALYAENEDLKKRIAQLEPENRQLRARNQELERENQQLLAEKQQLLAKNQMLEQMNERLQREKQQLENRLAERLPWTITVSASDSRYPLDCSLHEQIITAADDTRQRDFDPALDVQPAKWNGDFRMDGTGRVSRVNAARFVGGEGKFYVKVNPVFGRNIGVMLQTFVAGDNLGPVAVPDVSIPPERSWIFMGKFRVEAVNRITFTQATQAEREAEWLRLEKKPAPEKPEPTPVPANLTDAVMGAGFERRKKEFETSTGGGAPPPVRIALLQKWLAEAQSDRERTYVGSLLDRYGVGPRREPRPGVSTREQALEEFRKMEELRKRREQQPGPGPAPQPQPQPQPQQK